MTLPATEAVPESVEIIKHAKKSKGEAPAHFARLTAGQKEFMFLEPLE